MKDKIFLFIFILSFCIIEANAQSNIKSNYNIKKYGVYMIDSKFTLSPIYVNNTDEAYNPSYSYITYKQFENLLFFRRWWNSRWKSLVFDFLTNEAFEIDIFEVNFVRFETSTKLIINGLYDDYEKRIIGQVKNIELNFNNRNTAKENIGKEITANENEGNWIEELRIVGKNINLTPRPGSSGKTFLLKLFGKDLVFNCEEMIPYGYNVELFAIYNVTHKKYILLVSIDPGP
jgi:hypothetical protein